MPGIGDLEKYAGIFALACFAGIFLGGMLLSYFWKTFGPWKQLGELRVELAACEDHREEARKETARAMAKCAEIEAKFEILSEAVKLGGFSLRMDKDKR
jgi:hypothetical protein